MPELPEVETIARGLDAQVRGRRILSVHVLTPAIVRSGDLSTLVGGCIARVSRRAKLLMAGIDDGRVLIFHLKMTGRVWLASPARTLPKHAHLVLELEDRDRVVFEDPRRFGYCAVFSPSELDGWNFYSGLGPEPLQSTPEELQARIRDSKAGIKSRLLNQTVIAGVGNIYADESLFAARIHPASRTDAIPPARLGLLCRELQRIMLDAIDAGGSTISDYRNAYGQNGIFQERFEVYGKKGQPCPVCSRPLLARQIAGRTSTHCPACQVRY
jgi:formamidopyrimidine-DNA glycosylase